LAVEVVEVVEEKGAGIGWRRRVEGGNKASLPVKKVLRASWARESMTRARLGRSAIDQP
jgi:hypothetical protein